MFINVPFTRTDSDDFCHPCFALVEAENVAAAHELIASRHSGAEDDAFWSHEANDSGDTPEFCDDDAFYKSWSCDCGDDGCEDHESQTEMVQFHFRDAKAFETREAALMALPGGVLPDVEC